MRLLAAGLFAIALALVLVAGSIAWAAQTQRQVCSVPYPPQAGLPSYTVYCDKLTPDIP